MKYIRLFLTLIKRLIKRPSFLVLLLIIPISSILITNLEQTPKSKTSVGIILDENTKEEIFEKLNNKSEIVNFVEYKEEEKLLEDVAKNYIDSGFILTNNILENVISGKYEETIISYVSTSSVLANISKEHIASTIFETYSNEKYEKYINKYFDNKEAKNYAKETYIKYLSNSSTFDIEFIGTANETFSEEATSNIINIKNFLALLVFISGLNALIFDKEDKEAKRFITFCEDWKITIFNLLSQLLLIGLFIYISLFFTNSITNPLLELIKLVSYIILTTLYCFVLGKILKTKESVAITIPIISLICLITCPIFIDLSKYLPIIDIINKCFPITYYI